MPKAISRIIHKVIRDEVAAFVPAALALAVLVVIAVFIFADGRLFQALSSLDSRQRANEALRTAVSLPLYVVQKTSGGSLEPVDDATLTDELASFSDAIYSNIGDAKYNVWSALYRLNVNTKDLELVGNCVRQNGDTNNSLCPDTLDVEVEEKETRFVVLAAVRDPSDTIIDQEDYLVSKVPAGAHFPALGAVSPPYAQASAAY